MIRLKDEVDWNPAGNACSQTEDTVFCYLTIMSYPCKIPQCHKFIFPHIL